MASRATPPLKPTHFLILLLLAEEATYGVALMERLEDRSGGAVRLNAGSLYRTIATLVKNGLVEPIDLGDTGGCVGAPRKVYRTTASGLDALADEARRQVDLLESVRALDLLGDPS